VPITQKKQLDTSTINTHDMTLRQGIRKTAMCENAFFGTPQADTR
jgi:hypothetical protein